MGKIQPTITSFAYPTEMPDDLATRLGLKIYEHGGSYNGGAGPVISATNWTILAGEFRPYQLQDGSWRMRFNFAADRGSEQTISNVTFIITGIDFFEYSTNLQQPVNSYARRDSDGSYRGSFGLTNGSDGITVGYNHMGSISDLVRYFTVEGDVALNAKPTWAY